VVLAAVVFGACGSSAPNRPSATPPPPAVRTPTPPESTATASPVPPQTPRVRARRTVATGLQVPWGVAFEPDGDALVSERTTARIVRIPSGGGRPRRVMTVPGVARNAGEGGLLGLAVSPTYARDRLVYAYLTSASDNRIVRFRLGGRVSVILSGLAKAGIHNGGRIAFGPDGKLYATVGDAKNSGNAQNKNSLNGKILRLNPDGSAPSDNPFYSSGGNARYVWSWGHRNPQGLAWDSRGQLWAAEFGENSQDELNLIQKGGNYGWPSCEGTIGDCSGYIAPKRTWSTSQAGPSGIEIVNDWIYIAGVTGEQLFATQINAAGTGVGTVSTLFSGRWGRLRSVTKTPDGGLWLTSTNETPCSTSLRARRQRRPNSLSP